MIVVTFDSSMNFVNFLFVFVLTSFICAVILTNNKVVYSQSHFLSYKSVALSP